MFCPKCGNSINEDANLCSGCGFDVSEMEKCETIQTPAINAENQHSVTTSVSSSDEKAEKWDMIKKIAFPTVGVIVLIMCFMAASSISKSGTEIMQISSVGGKTLEEAYYRELGGIYSGIANIARALGISLASMLVWLGFKR